MAFHAQFIKMAILPDNIGPVLAVVCIESYLSGIFFISVILTAPDVNKKSGDGGADGFNLIDHFISNARQK